MNVGVKKIDLFHFEKQSIMQKLLQKELPQLRVVHQSEVLQLRRALADLQTEVLELKKNINGTNTQADPRKILLSSNGQHHLIS